MIFHDINYYKNFDSIAKEVFKLLAHTIKVNTFVITVFDQSQSFIVKSFNRNANLINSGDTLTFNQILCNMVNENNMELVVIDNIRDNPLTRDHPILTMLDNGCYMGAPITNEEEIIGTLCAFDIKPYDFKGYDEVLLKSLASLISQTVIIENGIIRDSLTGLYNRNFIYNYFEYNKEEFQKDMSLLYIDLDNFKYFNDAFGHDIGDIVIKRTAECLLESVPEDSYVARIGGDEFIILLQSSSSEDLILSTKQTADNILEQLSNMPIQIGDKEHKVSASMGVSFYPEHGNEMITLLKRADHSMYAAKEEKKRIHYYHS
ncbi:sensor domain-containing diguanylate cyclase [Peribacillus sp. NPDC097675]|uniref:sensor domain-containing diguanylate cyclase n=1 Tax=Peribacillus sp. NPDC097675 TaxID=3390618 RepID=UPI003D02304B